MLSIERITKRSDSRRYRTAEEATVALALLAQAGLGEWVQPDQAPRGGNAAVRFRLRPCSTPDSSDTCATCDPTALVPLSDIPAKKLEKHKENQASVGSVELSGSKQSTNSKQPNAKSPEQVSDDDVKPGTETFYL
jgi:hypothetical protein